MAQPASHDELKLELLRFAREGVDLIAIDHLPSLLPAESSHDFSSQLLPALLDLQGDGTGVWHRAYQSFLEKSQSI